MGRRDFFEEKKLKQLIYVFSITLIISIIAFVAVFVMYNHKLKEDSSQYLSDLGALNAIVPNDELNTVQETSSTSDKNVASATNSTNTTNTTNTTASTNKTKTNTPKNTVSKLPITSEVESTTNTTEENVVENTVQEQTVETTQEELNFIAPVSGEIIKDFAMDTLIYSNTLEEWTTHSGIDIKADKTTVVVASEAGTIESIKTDPRYGLTVTINHANGFKTIYANLLTTEFVTEGETVEKGQTIGTVGESSSFEVADETHLHFEMVKDSNYVNPTIYLKDI